MGLIFVSLSCMNRESLGNWKCMQWMVHKEANHISTEVFWSTFQAGHFYSSVWAPSIFCYSISVKFSYTSTLQLTLTKDRLCTAPYWAITFFQDLFYFLNLCLKRFSSVNKCMREQGLLIAFPSQYSTFIIRLEWKI